MEHEIVSNPGQIGHPSQNDGAIFRNWMFSDFVGTVMTILESFGMPEKQELAAKTQIKKAIWDLWRDRGMAIKDRDTDNKIFELMGLSNCSDTSQKVLSAPPKRSKK